MGAYSQSERHGVNLFSPLTRQIRIAQTDGVLYNVCD